MSAVVVEVAEDTCDHCGPSVRAYLYAEMPSGRSLAYCGSCGSRYLAGLLEQGATVIDQRHRIGDR